MFHDGKSKSGSAHCFRVAFVNPVETLEDAFLMLRRNADAGVLYCQKNVVPCPFYGHIHTSVFLIIFDRIIAEIVDDTVQKPGDALKYRGFSGTGDGNSGRLRLGFQTADGFFSQFIKIGIFALHIVSAFVKAGEADNILYQTYHALGFVVNLSSKRYFIAVPHQIIF